MLDRQKVKHSLPLTSGNPSICRMLIPEIARKQDVKIFCHTEKFFPSILIDFQHALLLDVVTICQFYILALYFRAFSGMTPEVGRKQGASGDNQK